MREFDQASKNKKRSRIQLPANPDNLGPEKQNELAGAVKAGLKEGHLPCPVAWNIAKKAGVSRIAVGEIADRMSVRISDCQIGFFSKEKTAYDASDHQSLGSGLIEALVNLDREGALDCENVFKLARQFESRPIIISRQAGALGFKISRCQLGCF